MHPVPAQVQAGLLRLRRRILVYLDRSEADMDFCGRCHLPLPAGDFESYAFCPWCDQAFCAAPPRSDEARRIIERPGAVEDDVQCGECGGEYAQPSRFPFRFCPECGAPFADEDEILIELPFTV